MPDKTCFSYLSLRRLLVDWQQGGQGAKDPFVWELTRAALAHSAARSHPAGEHQCSAELRVTGDRSCWALRDAPLHSPHCKRNLLHTVQRHLPSSAKEHRKAIQKCCVPILMGYGNYRALQNFCHNAPSFHPGTRDHRRISLVPQGMECSEQPRENRTCRHPPQLWVIKQWLHAAGSRLLCGISGRAPTTSACHSAQVINSLMLISWVLLCVYTQFCTLDSWFHLSPRCYCM